MKLLIKKQVLQFINEFVNKNISKELCIKYFKEDFLSSNLDINMWKDNISNNDLGNLFYNSLGLESFEWFDSYWEKGIRHFYKEYCEPYNEIRKIPFTLNEWINNVKINDVFFDKIMYDFYTGECDYAGFKNGKQFFEEQWELNNGIRYFYNNFIIKFKKDCNVKIIGEI